jgi:inner membrane transporter RhtA
MSSARTVAVLLSFDPVLAALLGAGLLGQLLDPVTIAGIALVAVAGGFSAALAGRRAPHALARRRRSSWRPAAMAGIAPVRFPRARTTV